MHGAPADQRTGCVRSCDRWVAAARPRSPVVCARVGAHRWQVFGLVGRPTRRRFPGPLRGFPVRVTAFAPTYRCGAAPDSHRVPSCLTGIRNPGEPPAGQILHLGPVTLEHRKMMACRGFLGFFDDCRTHAWSVVCAPHKRPNPAPERQRSNASGGVGHSLERHRGGRVRGGPREVPQGGREQLGKSPGKAWTRAGNLAYPVV